MQDVTGEKIVDFKEETNFRAKQMKN